MKFWERLKYHPRFNDIRIRRGWKQRSQELRSEIEQIEARYRPRFAAAATEEAHDELAAEAMNEIRRPDGELRYLQARLELEPLQNLVDRFGIEVPAEWYYETNNPFAMNPANRRKLRRLIVETRFEYWKKRGELLITILSLIIAILALWSD
jgi:hypothetical protein